MDCLEYVSKYVFFWFINSAWVPKLSKFPLLITNILSQFFDVDIRWVEIKTVIFLLVLFILLIMVFSVWVSTADKLSSKIRILGFLITALAIANLCFCPPDRFTPLSPNNVLYLSLNCSISFVKPAILMLSVISKFDASSFPNFKLFSIVSENKNVYWGTYPIESLRIF